MVRKQMKGTLEVIYTLMSAFFQEKLVLFIFVFIQYRPWSCLLVSLFIAAYLVLLHQGLRFLFEVSEFHLYNAVS